jgi:hypothetical protein
MVERGFTHIQGKAMPQKKFNPHQSSKNTLRGGGQENGVGKPIAYAPENCLTKIVRRQIAESDKSIC